MAEHQLDTTGWKPVEGHLAPEDYGWPVVADDIVTPDEWAPPLPEAPHDHKGYSEEKCLRCGWVMGHRPLNCMNDDTPHRFPSQQDEIERLRAALALAVGELSTYGPMRYTSPDQLMEHFLQEARRG